MIAEKLRRPLAMYEGDEDTYQAEEEEEAETMTLDRAGAASAGWKIVPEVMIV